MNEQSEGNFEQSEGNMERQLGVLGPERAQPDPKNPVCPYCEMDPMDVKYKPLPTPDGVLVFMLVMCGNEDCRKMISVTPMMVAPEKRIDTNSRVALPPPPLGRRR